MEQLLQTVGKVRRRLLVLAALRALPWTLAAGAALFLLLVGIRSITEIDVLLNQWVLIGIAVVASAAPIGWAWWTRPDDLTAAAAIDTRLDLAERLTSALQAGPAEPEFVEAVTRDAAKHAARVVPVRDFPYQAPAGLWVCLIPLAIGLAVAQWVTPRNLFASKTGPTPEEIAKKEQAAVKRIDALRPKAEQEAAKLQDKLPDPKDKDELRQKLDELKNAKSSDEARKAMADIVRLARKPVDRPEAKEVKALQDALGKQATEPVKNPAAAKMQEKLRQGDFKAAKDAAADLQKQIGALEDELKKEKDPAAAEAKQQKLNDIKKDLQNLAEQLRKDGRDKETEKQLEKSGLTPEEARRKLDQLNKPDTSEDRKKELEKEIKERLEKNGLDKEKIEQLMQQAKQAAKDNKRAGDLADKLEKAAKSLEQGSDGQPDFDSVREALQQGGEQLDDLEQLADSLREAEGRLSDLKKMQDQLGKGDMPGDMPGGEGDGEGQGKGDKAGDGGSGTDEGEGGSDMEGMGSGNRGRAAGGKRPAPKRTDYKTEVERVRGEVKGMKIIGKQLADGENIAGDNRIGYTGEIKVGQRAAAAMMKNEAIPSEYHDTVKRYYDLTRGEKTDKK